MVCFFIHSCLLVLYQLLGVTALFPKIESLTQKVYNYEEKFHSTSIKHLKADHTSGVKSILESALKYNFSFIHDLHEMSFRLQSNTTDSESFS